MTVLKTTKKKVCIGILFFVLVALIPITYKVTTSKMTVKTNAYYALLSQDGKITEVTSIKNKNVKTSVMYTLRDNNKVEEYDTIVANVLPKIFKEDKINNEVVKYYMTYDNDISNILKSSPLEYETKKGKLTLKETATKYLKENFTKFVLGNKKVNVNFYAVIDTNVLNTLIAQNNECATKVQDAKIIKEKNQFITQKEVNGTKLDTSTIVKDISVDNFPIDFTKYYEKPSVLSDDLIPICDAMNEYVKWSVTYDDGTVIHASTNAVKLNKKKEIVLNYDFLTEGLKKVSKSYNTVGKAVTFKNHSGKKIKVGNTKMSTWGNVVDTDKELSYLKSQFESKTSISDRKPEYLRKQDKIGNTYVEVSLSKQHVWVYVKGKLKMESDVVTGTKGKHDTPKGLYYMSECIPGKYLVGDGYKTWVNKWMRLTNQGVGLHDATWRSAFGGSIYTYSGSHGCVNLPSGFANNLFNIAYTGMPVIIY